MDKQLLMWVAIAAVFLLIEVFATQFVTLWFGLAALVVAVGVFIFPQLPLPASIVIWIVTSVIFVWLWFQRKSKPILSTDNQNQLIGQVAHVIAYNPQSREGILRFTLPIANRTEWPFECNTDVEIGSRVRVTQITPTGALNIEAP